MGVKWPGTNVLDFFSWESNVNSHTNYYRFGPKDAYNICPTEPVTLTAKAVGVDNDFLPPPNYIRLYWESDLGWLKWKSWAPLKRQSDYDNVWEATVPLGELSYNFKKDQAATLKVWLLMEFQSVDNTSEGDYIWLTKEFSNIEWKADFVLFKDRF